MIGLNQFRIFTGVLVAVTIAAVPSASAGASSTVALSRLVANANKDVTAIRQYYFCETTSCKTTKSTQSKAALAGTKNLQSLTQAAGSMVVINKLKGALKNFRADAVEMTNAIGEISSQTTNTTKTIVVGIVYFASSYLQTDLYVLARQSSHQSVKFKEWSTGIVAATQTLQIDIELETPKATTNELIACNEGLELIAQNMEAHLNSPSPVFNIEVQRMSQLLHDYSANAIHSFKVKATPAQRSALAASLKSFFAKFQSVTALENQLAA